MTNFKLQAYFEHFAMIKEKLLICGDFNLYFELSNDANTIKFNDILNTLDLQQGVKFATHKSKSHIGWFYNKKI